MSISSIAVSGLNAAQVGMLTTSHNIANASTPGYNRQVIAQGSNSPQFTGAGFVGMGTHIETVRRVYDQFLSRQVLSAEAGAAEMDAYSAQIRQIDNLLADPDAGLSPVMAAFFKGVQDVAANPSSIPGRQSMLSAAQALVARFQALDQRFAEIREGTNQQIAQQITQKATSGPGWRIGESVAHAKFGEGVIVNIEGGGSNARAQINFGRAGMKVLDLSVAKLERLGRG